MKLRWLQLYLDPDERFDRYEAADFLARTRFVSNYFTRRVRKLAFPTDGFNMVGVLGSTSPTGLPRRGLDTAVLCTVKYDPAAFDWTSEAGIARPALQMLMEGIECCSEVERIPLEEIRSFATDFESDGYRHCWVAYSKVLRPRRVRADLECTLTSKDFRLDLAVVAAGEEVRRLRVLDSRPREEFWEDEFKKPEIEGGFLVIRGRLGKETFRVAVDDLL
ncbi:MAG: hypothetical protein AAGB93_14970 [Planctomycetota bacterium]